MKHQRQYTGIHEYAYFIETASGLHLLSMCLFHVLSKLRESEIAMEEAFVSFFDKEGN